MMTIHFYLRYHTNYGQALFLTGNTGLLGDNDSSKAIRMSYYNHDYWHAKIELGDRFDDRIGYRYFLKDTDGTEIYDGEDSRFLDFSVLQPATVVTWDVWNGGNDYRNTYFTRAFGKVLLPQVTRVRRREVKNFTHEFRVKAPLLQPGEVICLSGSVPGLKNWSTADPIILAPRQDWFVARVTLSRNEWPASYKYGIYRVDEKRFVSFEEGENRSLQPVEGGETTVVLHDGFVNCNTYIWRGAGVAIPLFSLRSRSGFGVGELTDIHLLVDWARKTGLRLIQLLPVNDTTATHTATDSYPYGAISAFAIHPIYINLEKVAGKDNAALVKSLRKKQQQLNALPVVDYEKVMKFKWAFLRELYEAARETFKNDLGYFEFFDLNRHWLVPYAAFSYLREKYGTADFTKWKHHRSFDEAAIQKLVAPTKSHYDDIAFYYFVQYHLHLQLKAAVDYAHRNHVVLKGDIPIGIHRYSCDAWANGSLYNMNEQAGAPPDDFAIRGQNWGFPTYNWEQMKLDGFHWWRKRFDQMSNYFDAFRIDHILGFFRIWSIPVHAVEGVLGRFVPAIPVDIVEFEQRHIWFNHDRYCKPFITDAILAHTFGERSDEVKELFLDALGDGYYAMKAAFATQRQVATWFENNDLRHARLLQQGLFDLISNVVLIEEENSGGRKFHFRIGIAGTSSFQQLEYHTRERLHELYVNYFYRRQDHFWRQEALQKLPQLKRSTNMLICGEDLGMVPDCVPEVMQNLGILSLEIERMPKDANREFFHPNDAPYLSVVTPSTHDMSTVRSWWEEDRAKTQRFFNNVLGHSGEAPAFCEPWINKEIILQHLYSPAMWSIFQLQDLIAMDGNLRRENPAEERINEPSDPHHIWSYRMHLPLEQLVREDAFNNEIKRYVTESGR